MGAGKTTLGKELAKQLKFKFTDTDTAVELLTGKSIPDLFDEGGEVYFRMKEQEVIHSFINKDNCVVATGGGSPCFKDNMEWMNENGITIYLKLHRGVLFHRLLPEKKLRPLLSKLDDIALMEFIMNKLPERDFFYRQSKIIVKADKLSLNEILKLITENPLLKQNSSIAKT